MPTIIGTSLAANAHGSAVMTRTPTKPMKNIVNSCCGRNVGAWKLLNSLPMPP